MKVLTLAGLLMLSIVISGCTDYGYALNRLYGLDCRPEMLRDGKCVATREAKK